MNPPLADSKAQALSPTGFYSGLCLGCPGLIHTDGGGGLEGPSRGISTSRSTVARGSQCVWELGEGSRAEESSREHRAKSQSSLQSWVRRPRHASLRSLGVILDDREHDLNFSPTQETVTSCFSVVSRGPHSDLLSHQHHIIRPSTK